jgi:hypothetical protein
MILLQDDPDAKQYLPDVLVQSTPAHEQSAGFAAEPSLLTHGANWLHLFKETERVQ